MIPAKKKKRDREETERSDLNAFHQTDATCTACGRRGHIKRNCILIKHPDANHSNSKWIDSEKGKQWKAKNRSELPWSVLLDGSTWVNAPEKPKPKQGNNKFKSELNNKCPCTDDYLNSIINSTEFDFSSGHYVTDKEKSILTNLHDTNNVRDSNLIPFIITKDLVNIPVEALVDTGALHHNYISRKVADQLGLKLVENRNINF
jgi:hypothetical protein